MYTRVGFFLRCVFSPWLYSFIRILIHLSNFTTIYPSIYPSIHPSVCLFIHLRAPQKFLLTNGCLCDKQTTWRSTTRPTRSTLWSHYSSSLTNRSAFYLPHLIITNGCLCDCRAKPRRFMVSGRHTANILIMVVVVVLYCPASRPGAVWAVRHYLVRSRFPSFTVSHGEEDTGEARQHFILSTWWHPELLALLYSLFKGFRFADTFQTVFFFRAADIFVRLGPLDQPHCLQRSWGLVAECEWRNQAADLLGDSVQPDLPGDDCRGANKLPGDQLHGRLALRSDRRWQVPRHDFGPRRVEGSDLRLLAAGELQQGRLQCLGGKPQSC